MTQDLAAIRRIVSSGLRMMLMLNVPATIGLMVLAGPIVSLILERNRFTPFDTAQTAAALMFYAPGLVGYSAVKIASPTFYSLRDSRTPVLVSLVSVIVNLALNLSLVRVLGFRGLALGTALSALVNALALLWLLGRRLEGLETGRVVTALAKVTVASAAMGAAAYYSHVWLTAAIPGRGLLAQLVQVFGAIGVGVIVLAGSARLLRIVEFDDAVARVLRRLRATPAGPKA